MFPSFAKQQREITKICVVGERKPRRQEVQFPIGNRVDAVYIHFAEGKVWRRIRRQ